MKGAVIIIPARYHSTRYPGKPLVLLRDRNGNSKTLIQRSWEAAMAVNRIDAVFVATDDQRIAEHVVAFGGQVFMTSHGCANGTERCAEVLGKLHMEPDIVINLQGDAPLTPPWFMEQLIAAIKAHPDMDLATPVLRCDHAALEALLHDRKAGRVGGTTVVFNQNRQALYFSKEVIPYMDSVKMADWQHIPVFHHVGVYAYRPTVLKEYLQWPAGLLEKLEGLEQLRFLEHGRKVLCVEVDACGRPFWELNNPEDVSRIECAL